MVARPPASRKYVAPDSGSTGLGEPVPEVSTEQEALSQGSIGLIPTGLPAGLELSEPSPDRRAAPDTPDPAVGSPVEEGRPVRIDLAHKADLGGEGPRPEEPDRPIHPDKSAIGAFVREDLEA